LGHGGFDWIFWVDERKFVLIMLEREVERYLRTKVEKAGGLCLKFTSSTSGVPDRVVVLNRRTFFVELKAPGKTPRPLQLRVMGQMRERGARVEVIDSKESVDTLLASLYTPTYGS